MKILLSFVLFALLAISAAAQAIPWNLDRIDQRYWPVDGASYAPAATGRGVTVYVVDTGIQLDHPEFEGRAVKGFGKPNVDGCSGHGTHVAGTIGSKTYGVAKDVTLVSVRVYPCSGPTTAKTILDGLDWIARQRKKGPAVVNISIVQTSFSMDAEVQTLINKGYTVVVSAGNYSADACNYSPARLPDVITVGSIDEADTYDPSTNYGPCIDLFAPGMWIVSTWNDGGTFPLSGTSTAAPHVAGVAALYLEDHPNASPAEVRNAIVSNATSSVIYNVPPNTANLLLYSTF